MLWVLEQVANDRDGFRVRNASATADWAACRHHACCSRITEADGHDWIIRAVAQHIEAVGDQFAAGFKCADRVRQQRRCVAKDFKFDPVLSWIVELFKQITAKSRHANGVFGREAAGGVGQDGVPIKIQFIQQRSTFGVQEPFSTHGDGDGGCAGSFKRFAHEFKCFVLCGSDDQAAVDRKRAELQRWDMG